MARRVYRWVPFLVILLSSGSAMVLPASSVLIPTVYMTPSNNPPATYLDYKWNVTIWVSSYGASAVHAWSVRLNYNGVAAGINVSRAWVADFDSSYIFTGRASAKPKSEITSASSVLVHDELLEQPDAAVSGQVKLAVVEFVMLRGPGKFETKTTMLNMINQDTYLLDQNSRTIPIIAENGVYTLSWPLFYVPHTGLAPSLVVEPQLNSSFAVELAVKDVFSDWGWFRGTFNLTYDSSLIELAEITVNRTVWNDAVTAELGFGTAYLSVSATSRVYGDRVDVASLEFKVIGFGMSHISISEAHAFSVFFGEIPLIFREDLPPSSLVVTGIRNAAVSGVTLNASRVRRGDTVSIDVTVQNRGNFTESFEVTTYYASVQKVPNTLSIFIPIETLSIFNLSPNESGRLTFVWNTSDVTYSEYIIMAGVSPLVGELDQSDNFLTSEGTVSFSILGDLNWDFKVDIRDVARAALAFGSYSGGPRWDSAADLNLDGNVDMRDLVVIAKNFGKT